MWFSFTKTGPENVSNVCGLGCCQIHGVCKDKYVPQLYCTLECEAGIWYLVSRHAESVVMAKAGK